MQGPIDSRDALCKGKVGSRRGLQVLIGRAKSQFERSQGVTSTMPVDKSADGETDDVQWDDIGEF